MRILITGGSGFIGTNLIKKLVSTNVHTILNLDNSAPKDINHLDYWKSCDILDPKQIADLFNSFRPDAVVHLAGRTDTDPENKLEDYLVNTDGSLNILNAIKCCTEVKRVIMTSTQFVNQYKGIPKNDEDYAPHTVYGESKVIMENMIRNAHLNCVWTIIRPTNIWGPWHIRYPFEFWKIMSRGLYFHPGREPVIRSYGYVGNVVSQIISILEAPVEKVNAQVFYVGDLPIDIYHWVNGFSLRQTGKNVRVVPRFVVSTLAYIGDILSVVRIKFPLTASRYKSMTHSNTTPMERTINAFGIPPYTLEQGIEETVMWMRKEHPDLVKVK